MIAGLETEVGNPPHRAYEGVLFLALAIRHALVRRIGYLDEQGVEVPGHGNEIIL